MLSDQEKAVLERWRKNAVEPIAQVLGEMQGELNGESLEIAAEAIGAEINEAMGVLLYEAGAKSIVDIGTELRIVAQATLVAALNGALPIDHRYIVAMRLAQRVSAPLFACIERQAIPGMHEATERAVVVMLDQQALKDGKKPSLTVQRFRPDDEELEDLLDK